MTDERPDTPEPEFEPEAQVEPTFEVEETAEPTLVEVRRTPNYWNFMILFAVLAGIAITIITFSLPYDAETATYSRGTVYGFALLISVAFGLALGAVIALIAERVSRRSIRLVEAQKITGKPKDR
ncbi:hypothetical protein [Gryllotalpicola protaetiae]|uniref:Potassium transporter Trk n=1 Tax=Gryllotalpicola protaetiae TaxID=2419771 RepID=A0A387BY08_9MICO|nr:hypothetical protein [Gryllotalpicola protaetiae]AYG03231.1 hypothetical protein D7I44_06615 [Gryllotalpicola protaetiae]